MDRFFVMRHAKSSWEHPVSDHERPLNKRGRNDAETMGQRLAAAPPALIVSSTAERAAQTALRVARCVGIDDGEIVFEGRLYHAGPEQILSVAQDYLTHNELLLVAHNPGLTDLVNRLACGRLDNLPTSGIARFDYESEISDVTTETPKQVWIDFPKNPDGLLKLS